METNNNLVPKPLLWLVGIFLIALMGIIAADKALDISKKSKDNKEPQHTISISAEGKVKATPDLATVNLGVLTRGTSAADVQDKNSQKINQIIEFVKQQGIPKEDVQTTNFNVYPQYNYDNGKNTIVGYEANQTVRITVRDVDKTTEKLGKIIDGATNNGANEINGVSMSFDDPDNLRQQAREKAIEKAKEKAQEMAKVAGIKLGKVVSVQEAGMGGGYPMPTYAYDQAESYGVARNMAMKSVAPAIEPGSQDVTAQMTVVFEVK